MKGKDFKIFGFEYTHTSDKTKLSIETSKSTIIFIMITVCVISGQLDLLANLLTLFGISQVK
jgi:hypothetical protein